MKKKRRKMKRRKMKTKKGWGKKERTVTRGAVMATRLTKETTQRFDFPVTHKVSNALAHTGFSSR